MLKRLSHSLLGEKSATSGDESVDLLLKDCDVMIKDLKELAPQESSLFAPLKDILSLDILKRKSQRSKRLNVASSELYRELTPKVQVIETSLRTKLSQITERKAALQDQAQHLQPRLNACILYNVAELQTLDVFISDCKEILGKLRAESSLINEMKKFNFEITQQAAHAINKKEKFSAWAYVMRSMKPRSESEEIDNEHLFFLDRLGAIDKCVGDLESALSHAIESQATHSSNLESCNFVRRELLEVTNSSPGIFKKFYNIIIYTVYYIYPTIKYGFFFFLDYLFLRIPLLFPIFFI
jgi:hypothetical protein